MTDPIPVPREELEKIRRVVRDAEAFAPARMGTPPLNCSCLSCRSLFALATLDRLLKKD